LIQVLVVDRNILDTKDLDFASRRDMDMAIALLVGSRRHVALYVYS
jgi:hypothetical protein